MPVDPDYDRWRAVRNDSDGYTSRKFYASNEVVFVRETENFSNQEPDEELLRDLYRNYSSGSQLVYNCSQRSCEKRFISEWQLRTNEWYPRQPVEELENRERDDVFNISYITDSGNFVKADMREKYRFRPLNDDIEQPWEIEPYRDRLLVTESKGDVSLIWPENGSRQRISFPYSYNSTDTTGLLGAEVLDSQDDPEILLYHTYNRSGFYKTHRVSVFKLENGSLIEEEVLVDEIPGSKWHSGGRIEQGPDGLIYITTGEANLAVPAGDASNKAGKVLRVSPDGSIPDGNLEGQVYMKGFRNPQGLAWTSEGDIAVSEHGHVHNDAVHLGYSEDHGWPVSRCGVNALETIFETGFEEEASEAFEDRYGAPATPRETVPDEETAFCTGNWTVAPSGIAYVDDFRGFDNEILVAGMRGKHIQHLEVDNGEITANYIGGFRTTTGEPQRIRDVALIDGELYAIGKRSGLFVLEPAY